MRDNKKNWSATWQIFLSTKDLFFCLKECFVIAVISKSSYTQS
jgi:hypothetical protein